MAKKDNKLPQVSQEQFQNKQLSIFQTFLTNNEKEDEDVSNAIPLWDTIPRYSVSARAMIKMRDENGYLKLHETNFQHKGTEYKVTIHPAMIKEKDKEGNETVKSYYPSDSECLVEEALRKLASVQNMGVHEPTKRTGVLFTLYQLRQELINRGHSRTCAELVKSLNILSTSIIEITNVSNKGNGVARSPYFPRLATVTRADYDANPDAKWYVEFHSMITQSLDKITFRQFNYSVTMQFRSQLTRWLHKLLIEKWTNASMLHSFVLQYSTVFRDSGLLNEYSRTRDAIKALSGCIDELIEHGVLSRVESKNVYGENKKKIIDVVYTLYPTQKFVGEVKAANARLRDLK